MSLIAERTARRAAAAVIATASLGVAAPQATAADADTVTVAGVTIAADADSASRAIAQAEPQALAQGVTLCGPGYVFTWAERLPDSRRYGTLFMYQKGGVASCAWFDNNMGAPMYMKLKLCENSAPAGQSPKCVTDEGRFTNYAGPVHVNELCGNVTAIMKASKDTKEAIIDRVRTIAPCK
ncbi:hypothetical protein [Streptomyces sp. NPDC059994]|uniref:hypothetical protein n=1 Tax=Streptomyces sp. NPDC059994 TaxID=3347029 RepID=UPI00368FA067